MSPHHQISACDLFQQLRVALTAVLGSAATAALIRRAAKRALASAGGTDGLAGLEVLLRGFEFEYLVPPSWHQVGSAKPLADFRCFVDEHLRPILVELTGNVGARILDPVSVLARDAAAAAEPAPRSLR